MTAKYSPLGPPVPHTELDRLLDEARKTPVTESVLREQRISFAYGNAFDNPLITKESVRKASERIRLLD